MNRFHWGWINSLYLSMYQPGVVMEMDIEPTYNRWHVKSVASFQHTSLLTVLTREEGVHCFSLHSLHRLFLSQVCESMWGRASMHRCYCLYHPATWVIVSSPVMWVWLTLLSFVAITAAPGITRPNLGHTTSYIVQHDLGMLTVLSLYFIYFSIFLFSLNCPFISLRLAHSWKALSL